MDQEKRGKFKVAKIKIGTLLSTLQKLKRMERGRSEQFCANKLNGQIPRSIKPTTSVNLCYCSYIPKTR